MRLRRGTQKLQTNIERREQRIEEKKNHNNNCEVEDANELVKSFELWRL